MSSVSRNSVWKILLSLCTVLSCTACGIPAPFKQLIAPNPIYNVAVQFFEFQKTTDGATVESEFRGFELYYRFFENVPGNEVYADTFEELASKGYRRVNSKDDRIGSITKPLILVDPADRGTTFAMTIDFSGLTSPDYLIAQDNPDITASVPLNPPLNVPITDFRRGVVRTVPADDEYKKFSDFLATDSDISGIDWASFQSSGKLIFYVLSYGYDIDEFGELYSEPVLLGDIAFDFVP